MNGKSIIGFTPSQAVYKVSLPVGTPSLTVEPVSAYPAGEQTITITPNPLPTGEAINGTTVQIVVSAPGATSNKTYKLNIKIEESSYSYLADLQVVGEQVSDINPSVFNDPTILAFDPEVTTYYVNLKMGTKELPYILYTPGQPVSPSWQETAPTRRSINSFSPPLNRRSQPLPVWRSVVCLWSVSRRM